MSQSVNRILLVSYYVPSRSHGGGLRLLDLYGQIKRVFPKARLDLIASCHSEEEALESDAKSLFSDVSLLDPVDFNEAGLRRLQLSWGQYDIVDLQYLQSGKFIRFFKKAGVRRVIFSPMESMTRSARKAFRGFDWARPTLIRVWNELCHAVEELGYIWLADRVLCVSQKDADVLRLFTPWRRVSVIETGVSPLEFPLSLSNANLVRRLDPAKRIVFVAFFGSPTNRDALAWYLSEVHPLIAEAVPDYRFEIVGRGLDEKPAYGDQVDVVGEVNSIEAQLQGAWVGIAPALSGAGLRGKINQYAAAGVPCVASILAADGLAYQDDESILLAGSASIFAKQCIRLLSYQADNIIIGASARSVCLAHYVWDAKLAQIGETYGDAHRERT